MDKELENLWRPNKPQTHSIPNGNREEYKIIVDREMIFLGRTKPNETKRLQLFA